MAIRIYRILYICAIHRYVDAKLLSANIVDRGLDDGVVYRCCHGVVAIIVVVADTVGVCHISICRDISLPVYALVADVNNAKLLHKCLEVVATTSRHLWRSLALFTSATRA